MSERATLVLSGFGLAFGANVVVPELTLSVRARGVTLLMGPTSTGKSALLRTLAGLNDAQPTLRTWGSALYDGAPITEQHRPAMVQQHARLVTASVHENVVVGARDRSRWSRPEQARRIRAILAELGRTDLGERLDRDAIDLDIADQRVLALARAVASEAKLVLVDEPTAGLEGDAAERVLSAIEHAARQRAVLVTSHHRGHARRLGGELALLAGGRLLEMGETHAVLDGATTEAGREFLRTGGTSLPSPMARPEDLASDVLPPPPLPEAAARAGRVAPRHFYWLLPGQLAGTPRPGIIAELDDDLDSLAALGITTLVCLEEEQPVPEGALRARGLRSEHVPLADMKAPSLDDATRLCALVDAARERGEVLAVHCLAGLGRTGTVLATYLVHHGATPLEAIERVRSLRPLSVQTDEQLRFVSRFSERRVAAPAVFPTVPQPEKEGPNDVTR